MNKKAVGAISSCLIALLIFSASFSLLTPGFYSSETLNWQVQSYGQDLVDLFVVVPTFIVATIMLFKERKFGLLLWGGTLAYLVYSFLIYCFAVHFNQLFIIYCFILGMSSYAFAYFLWSLQKEKFTGMVQRSLLRVTAFYFILIAVAFYLLWLSEIIPATLENTLPKSLAHAGLFTNPVHVIDLAICLPGIFLTGIALLKKYPIAIPVAQVILVFLVLMDVTIGTLIIMMKRKGIEGNIGIVYMMGALALFSVGLLLAYFRSKNESPCITHL